MSYVFFNSGHDFTRFYSTYKVSLLILFISKYSKAGVWLKNLLRPPSVIYSNPPNLMILSSSNLLSNFLYFSSSPRDYYSGWGEGGLCLKLGIPDIKCVKQSSLMLLEPVNIIYLNWAQFPSFLQTFFPMNFWGLKETSIISNLRTEFMMIRHNGSSFIFSQADR